MLRVALLLLLAVLPGRSVAGALPADWLRQLEGLAEQAAQAALPPQGRVDIVMGEADPRLRLAACAQVQPFLPPGQKLWGRSRLGLRCVQGATRWAITVPVQVRVFAPAWVAAQALPAGTVLDAALLTRQETEWSADHSPAFAQQDASALVGRQLQRPLLAGEALRQSHLKPRQWFAAGEPVRLTLSGDGFSVQAQAQSLAPGFEGQAVRVRLDSGRVLSVWPVAERQAELLL